MTASAHSTVGFVGNNLTSLGRKSEAYMTTHNEINNFSGSLKKLMRDLLHMQMLFLLKGLSAIESLSLQITKMNSDLKSKQLFVSGCSRITVLKMGEQYLTGSMCLISVSDLPWLIGSFF